MVNKVFQATVNLENSDDRLAAVEEAKRSGKPFVSKASNGSQVIPRETSAQILEEQSALNTYTDSKGRTYAIHLQAYHTAAKDPEFIWETNEEKAAAHEEASKQLTLLRIAEEELVRQRKADGFDPSFAIQIQNQARANADNDAAETYATTAAARPRNNIYNVIDQSIQILNSNDVDKLTQVQLGQLLRTAAPNIPTANENNARAAIVIKDRIVATELDYDDYFSLELELDHYGTETLEDATDPEELESDAAATLASFNRGG